MSVHVRIPDSDKQSTVVTTIVFAILLIVVIALLVGVLQSDREALIRRVEQERFEALENVVALMTEDVTDVLDDLRLLGQVAESESGADIARSVLAGVPSYHSVALWNGAGQRSLLVTDPRREAPAEALLKAMDGVAAELGRDGRALEVSSVVELDGQYFRVFGQRPPAGPTVVLVVDTSAWLSGLRLVSSDPSNRVLVLGPGGRIAPATDAELAPRLAKESVHGQVDELLTSMRSGASGTRLLGGEAALALGLPDSRAVVAFASMAFEGGESWSVATVTSVESLESQETALVRRFLAAMGIALLLLGVFGTYVVVSTRRAALLRERLVHASELAEVNAQLLHAEKLATVGGLSAGIAHEIGTPLGVIRGRAEYVLKKIGDDHAQAGSLRTIIEQIDRVSKIIQGLLDFSRPRPADGRPTALSDVAEQAVALMAIEFERADIALVVEIAPDVPKILADPDHLQQVLVNLLVNARDACSAGNRVRIVGRRVDDTVVLEVADDGQGIPAEIVNQVFDPFFTTKKRGHGTGLGLAVVSQIVRSHGGTVEVESTEGSGTIVRTVWPSIQ